MNADPIPLEIDCRTVKARLDSGAPMMLIDCREQDEYNLVRIEEARLIPMSQFIERFSELEGQQASELVVMCHHGVRSRQVAAWLRQQGFGSARSMTGGIDRWSVEIDPSLPRY